MKRSLPLFLLLGGVSAFSQNINDNKVTFAYIQLPSHPIAKEYKTYEVKLNRDYEKANEDSLNVFQVKLEAATAQYESEMTVWRDQKRSLYRTYLTQMSAWEKQKNAGGTAAQPVEPNYPPQPVKQEIPDPLLHSDVNDDMVNQSIDIAGYSKGSGGATITLTMSPISAISIREEIKGTGAETKYNYFCNYQMPVEIKVETPSQGVILNTIASPGIQTYTLQSYSSRYDYELWLLDNKAQFWIDLENYARKGVLTEVNTLLNESCGFVNKTHYTEVYSVKKHKDWEYNDATEAYTFAMQGYQLIGSSRDRSQAHPKLNQAIEIWKKMLNESDLNDNKARINDKITAMLQVNIAEAYIWMSKFDMADQYLNLAINSGEGKFKRFAQDLQNLSTQLKLRWVANY